MLTGSVSCHTVPCEPSKGARFVCVNAVTAGNRMAPGANTLNSLVCHQCGACMPTYDGRGWGVRRTTHLLLQPRQHCAKSLAGQADRLACGNWGGRVRGSKRETHQRSGNMGQQRMVCSPGWTCRLPVYGMHPYATLAVSSYQGLWWPLSQPQT